MIDLALLPQRRDAPTLVVDGPFTAATLSWQVAPPRDALVLVVKCTLAIGQAAACQPLADQPPLSGDVTEDGNEAAPGPLRYASDFAPHKPLADVLLVGHAYPASPRAAVGSAQLLFGEALRKVVAVLGERSWQGGVPSEPRPYQKVPLAWSRAFGGAGFEANPAGTGLGADTTPPQLERADQLLRARGEKPPPACFAPLSPLWHERACALGSYDARWLRERWPYYPADFDWHHFNAAPPDQRIPFPRGDESFHLAGVHPTLPVLSGRLPGIVPRAWAVVPAASSGAALRALGLQLDTVAFDADASTVTLVWRGALEVSAESAPEIALLFVAATTIEERPGTPEAEGRLASILATRRGLGTTPKPAAAPVPRAVESPLPGAPAVERDALRATLGATTSLAGAMLGGCDAGSLDFAGRDLRGAVLSGARLDGTSFDRAHLEGAVLVGASAVGASFAGAHLAGANLAEADLSDADFSGADLSDVSLAGARAPRARFVGSQLARAACSDVDFTEAICDEARCEASDWSGAKLGRARFVKACLDDATLYDAQAERARFEDASLLRLRADDANLSHASFARAKASDASFVGATLRAASFEEAELERTIFAHADLSQARLERARAMGARFRDAKLGHVDARRANLKEASFESADLSGADLRGANLWGAELWKARRDGAKLEGALLDNTKLAR